ncbi:MAG TPA: alginate lyase family protein [Ohtaekwangia sp.]
MTRFLQWYRLARSMGLRYVLFRIVFELKRKSGLLKRSYPVNPHFKTWITRDQWRKEAPAFFFHSRNDFYASGFHSALLAEKANRIRKGEVHYFQGEWKTVNPDDWLTNFTTGHRYNNQEHWTAIPDFHPVYGDIKYVWERSRFSFLQTILRHDAQSGMDSSEWVFSQIESWIHHNPINQGPNYRCSQETSLRVFNWTLALYFYRDAESLTEERFQKIMFTIYWQLRHVRSNIHFSRIAVRNNHAVTETLALYTAGLLFPFFDEAAEWKTSGKKWFEEEIAYQIYEDGAYLQFSFNYHRVVIQLLTWGISLANEHDERFADIVYQRAYASLKLLLHCQDPVSGQLPNYGANDGSLFFHWNDLSFRDFRPSLDALHYLLTSANCYERKFEDRMWFGVRGLARYEAIRVPDGCHAFITGGLYMYRQQDLMVWINCVRYKDRPSQADELHLDVWHNGKNILRDAGSYRYNAEPEVVRYFSGTESHNTVMIGDNDQMLKGPRFIWLNWSQGLSGRWEEKTDQVTFTGKASVFNHLGSITHKRSIDIHKTKKTLIVSDQITGASGNSVRQLWHIDPELRDEIQVHTVSASGDVVRTETMKYFSPTYGVLEDGLQIEFTTINDTLTTQISFS